MALDLDVAGVEDAGIAGQGLAQFEPDPDGDGGREVGPAAPDGDAADPQWVVWPDAPRETAWVEGEQAAWTTR